MPHAPEWTAQTLDKFLDALADRTPTPGGGSVIALAAGTATALARMVVAYSIRPDQPADILENLTESARQLATADSLLRALISQDAEAYAHLRDAAKLRKQDSANEPAYQRAVLAASAVPLEVAALSAQVLATLDAIKTHLNPHLQSDLLVSASLCDTAAIGAVPLLDVNAAELADAEQRHRLIGSMCEIRGRCTDIRRRIEAFVSGRSHTAA